MEVPSYKLNASLRGVLAQRLLRRVARNAAFNDRLMMQQLFHRFATGHTIRFATNLSEEKQQRKQEGNLCAKFEGSGYKGRAAPMSS